MITTVQSIRYRLHRVNKNWLGLVGGEPGSGKSYLAVVLAKLIDPSFTVKERVVFNYKSFLKLLNSGKLKRGNVIIWDEAGVGIAARDWYTQANKAVNYVLQTFRFLNLGIIFTCPNMGFLDSQTRQLFNHLIEVQYIDTTKNQVVAKVFEIQVSVRYGDNYFKYRIDHSTGERVEIIRVGKPTPSMIVDYEEIKQGFAKDLYQEQEKDIEYMEQKKRQYRTSDYEIIEDIIKKKGIARYQTDDTRSKTGINSTKIMTDYNISQQRGMRIAQRVADSIKEGSITV